MMPRPAYLGKYNVTTHGHAQGYTTTKTYNAWNNMVKRCTYMNHPSYKWYGGRGISVALRWREFPNFLIDMGECPAGLTLDRIDNEGNYEPGNCRWATIAEQKANQRRRNGRYSVGSRYVS